MNDSVVMRKLMIVDTNRIRQVSPGKSTMSSSESSVYFVFDAPFLNGNIEVYAYNTYGDY